MHPTKGTVAFGAALFGWAFSLRTFARIYSKKFNCSEDVLMEKLWGDNYYDPSIKQWTTSETGQDGRKLERGFVEFIMNPIIKLVQATMDENKKEQVFKICDSLGIKLKAEEKELKGKFLMKAVMMKWLHAGQALLEMIVTKLPSPAVAQSYRTSYLYEGELDDPCA